MIKYLVIGVIGAGLLACSSVTTISVSAESVPITKEYERTNKIDSIISPFRTTLAEEMEVVIAIADQEFIKGRPNGSLNNWSADAVLASQRFRLDIRIPTFCLLNFGGLRNPISKGEVTLGDLYRLMPFDNEIVCVELPISSIEDIEKYLKLSGGEPIAGARLVDGKLRIDDFDVHSESVLVVTSDYLFNGGDKMTFFENSISKFDTGILLRDALINQAKIQGQLVWNNDARISF
jgi:2',3'-cyclic-nucleotide 2'-phosphodiesterase (5'-nucleotidase family)